MCVCVCLVVRVGVRSACVCVWCIQVVCPISIVCWLQPSMTLTRNLWLKKENTSTLHEAKDYISKQIDQWTRLWSPLTPKNIYIWSNVNKVYMWEFPRPATLRERFGLGISFVCFIYFNACFRKGWKGWQRSLLCTEKGNILLILHKASAELRKC